MDPRAVVQSYLDSYKSMMSALGSLTISASDAPAWVVGSVRAESNEMIVNVVMPHAKGTAQGNHTSDLASVLPASTVMAAELHSIGKLVTTQLTALQAQMPGNSSLTNVKDALGLIGGVDWLGDGVAVVTKSGSSYGGGVVVQTPDASTASSKVTLVNNVVALAGGSLGLTSRDETYKGATITIIHVPSSVVGTPMEIAVAAAGKMIVAGYGDTFVKEVIDTTPSTSLASQSDYSTVMAATGLNNAESVYVNIPALEDQIGQAVFGISPSKWTLNYKPYFDHLGGVGFSVVDGNTVILRLIVTAK
jgi:hypothetical protein